MELLSLCVATWFYDDAHRTVPELTAGGNKDADIATPNKDAK